ncbi:MAG: polyphosphate kinase 1 [Bdellovibrionia bacterium]
MTEKKTTRKKAKQKKLEVKEHPLSSAQLFTNREIGWLQFNNRVLQQALDERNPLLERVKFLSISASNMDEFFMKRVGGLKRQVAYGVHSKSGDGQTPLQQLNSIRAFVEPMIKRQADAFLKSLIPALEKKKIYLVKWDQLTADEKVEVKKYYKKNVFPVLTPLSVDPGHPFPFISNLSTSLGVTLKHPITEEKLFARVKIPKVLPQWIKIESGPSGVRFLSLIELIKANIAELFPNMKVLKMMAFRLTRNADSDRDEEDSEDLLEMIEEELRQRRFAEVVRLEHGPKPDPWMLGFLMEELELAPEDIYQHDGDLDYTSLNDIYDLDRSDLKFETHHSVVPQALGEDSVTFFQAIKNQDFLLHHPFESFAGTVEKFIAHAADDPKVLAIKMTLYRTGDNSPFIKSLIRAAELGKQVVCLIELKARFDEERNIFWAQALENAGVHVVYGVVGLKTHAKTALVVRQEPEGIKSYCHIGTGNYNVATSRFYTDLGLLTAKEEITEDVVEFFHYLTGRSLKSDYKNLLIAPVNMFKKFQALIEREIDHAKAGKPSLIIAKCNNMEENDISTSLYRASHKGVDVQMLVRGFCCLRPGVKGLSERIHVKSIIGRFLEHSRVFYFRNGKDNPQEGDFYIGSADWMYRNLHARVEAVVPIFDPQLKEKLWEILQMYIHDERQSWHMQKDGSYISKNSQGVGVQQLLILQNQKMRSGSTEDQE